MHSKRLPKDIIFFIRWKTEPYSAIKEAIKSRWNIEICEFAISYHKHNKTTVETAPLKTNCQKPKNAAKQ
jgi:hypothetical protein